VELTGKVYLIGGLVGRHNATSSVLVYNYGAQEWSEFVDLPTPLHHASAVTYNDLIVVVGGFVSKDVWSPRVIALNTSHSQPRWEDLARMRTPRAAAAVIRVEDDIFVIGGMDEDTYGRAVESLNIRSLSWKTHAPLPAGRNHMCAGRENSTLFVYGGKWAKGVSFDTVFSYDIATGGYGNTTTLPWALNSHSCVILTPVPRQPSVNIIFGGKNDSDVSDSSWVHHAGVNLWEVAGAMAGPRHGMASAGSEGTVFAIGGSPILSDAYSCVFEALHLTDTYNRLYGGTSRVPSPTPSPDDAGMSQKHSGNRARVVGAVMAVGVGIVALVLVGLCVRRMRQRSRFEAIGNDTQELTSV